MERLLAAGGQARSVEDLKANLRFILEQAAGLSSEERDALTIFLPRVERMLDTLSGSGVPETLVHGDFHFGNVVRGASAHLFYDWTDAAITHPFFDLVHATWMVEQDVRSELERAYLGVWREAFPNSAIERAFSAASTAAHFYFADAYLRIGAAQEPAARWEFAGVPERYLRRALAALEDA